MQTARVEAQRPQQRPQLPNPEPIALRDISWHALPAGASTDGPLVCVTPRDYEDMAINRADVLRFVREAMWRLRYYRDELQTEGE